mgnify:CR=1 FL=1
MDRYMNAFKEFKKKFQNGNNIDDKVVTQNLEEYKNKKEEMEALEELLPKDIWKTELKEFITAYKKWYKQNYEEYLKEIDDLSNSFKKNSKSKKKKKTKTKKKTKNTSSK